LDEESDAELDAELDEDDEAVDGVDV